jgi:cytochrome c556
MTRVLRAVLTPLTLVAVLFVSVGCGKQDNSGPTAGPGPGGPSKIKQIMMKVAKGPQALTPLIGKELEADPPDWAALQPQAKEYAELASDLGKIDAPRGSKESWQTHTESYAAAAADLERAAEAKDRDKAKAAHSRLGESCKSCHDDHRGGGRRPGG